MTETLYDAVRALAAGSPYAVEPTRKGFDVHVDVADAQWYTLVQKQGLRSTVVHHVAVDEDKRTFTVADDSRTVSWETGGDGRRPVLRGSAQRMVGRTIVLGTRKEWAWDEKLRYGKVLDYTLDTEESRSLIRTAGRELGYRERLPGVVKGAIVMAAIGGGGAVLTLVVLAVGALAGKF